MAVVLVIQRIEFDIIEFLIVGKWAWNETMRHAEGDYIGNQRNLNGLC